MSKQFWSRLLVIALAAVLSPPVLALGLGEAQVRSYMSQPLNLRIQLISRSEAELATVTANLASLDDYRIIGLDRGALNVPVNFMVVADLEDPHILVTSTVPVNDPVVQLVVEVVWSSGRMLRQYTVFLDPPTFQSAAPVPQPSAPPPEPRPETRPEPEVDPVPAEPVVREEPRIAQQATEPESPFVDEPPAPLPPPEVELEPEAEPEAEPVTAVENLEIDTGPPFEPEPEVAEPGPVEPAGEDPGAAETEAAEPEVAEPDVVEPEVAEPETAEPEVAEPDVVEPEVAEPEVAEPDVVESEMAEAEVAEPDVVEPEQLDQAGPEPEPAVELPPADPVYRAVQPDPERGGDVYGPVQSGETLWGIAKEWGDERDLGVNKVMLAIQQQNPGAFNKGNINSLRRGAILRMPTASDVNRISARKAMLEVMRQEELYRNRWDSLTAQESIPAIADIEATTQPAPPPAEVAAVDESRLELVPPALDEPDADTRLAQGNADSTAASGGESVVEELARAQEELANARQENEYLNERIAELEAELSRREAESGAGVQDTGLAELEQRLETERQSGETEEVTVTPPREEQAWYARYWGWFLVGVVAIVAALVWWLRGRARPPDEEPGPGAGEETDEAPEQGHGEPGMDADVAPARIVARPDPDEEAVELDSSDPETQLDLARAYLSMGDVDAARGMLEAVIEAGDEEQAEQARGMLESL